MAEEKVNKEIEKKEEKVSKKTKLSLTDKLRKNPWIVSTAVLALILIIVMIVSFTGGMTGNTISAGEAGENLLGFYTSQGASGLELKDVEEVSGLYKVDFLYQGAIVPVYVTKDGTLAGSLNSIVVPSNSNTNNNQATEVPKSDNPEIDLFIWSYCPYGVQAQGPMAEVANLLGNSADFETVLYYDGHGVYETQQNKIQECIQQEAPDKYWDYASGFVEDIYPTCGSTRDEQCDLSESVMLMNNLGIDSESVLVCVDSDGEDLIGQASQEAQQLGVTGSPTIVINGVKANVARNAEAIKQAVCSAFTEGNAPSECDEVLNSDAAAASGSC